MSKFKPIIPQDTTYLSGMKSIMSDSYEKDRVSYIKDVEYVKRGDTSLKLQLLIPGPRENNEKKPLVVYVQGSAWMKQDCYRAIPMLTCIAKKGYVMASVEYRPSTTAIFPGFLQDVKSAIRFLRANADEYGIDKEKVAIWGDSSGGHGALLVGLTGDYPEFKTDDNQQETDCVDAVVDFYGPTDVTKINDTPRNPEFVYSKEKTPEDLLYGGSVKEHPEISQKGNPLNYINKKDAIPPIFIAHGDRDSMVPFNQSVILYEKLLECNKVVEFYKVIGGEHGTYVWSDDLLEKVYKFIAAYI